MQDEDLVKIGIACGEVADALFPHAFDRHRREKLALSLVDLARLVARQTHTSLEALEVRVAALEKDSHPPVDVASIVLQAIEDAFRRGRLKLVDRR